MGVCFDCSCRWMQSNKLRRKKSKKPYSRCVGRKEIDLTVHEDVVVTLVSSIAVVSFTFRQKTSFYTSRKWSWFSIATVVSFNRHATSCGKLYRLSIEKKIYLFEKRMGWREANDDNKCFWHEGVFLCINLSLLKILRCLLKGMYCMIGLAGSVYANMRLVRIGMRERTRDRMCGRFIESRHTYTYTYQALLESKSSEKSFLYVIKLTKYGVCNLWSCECGYIPSFYFIFHVPLILESHLSKDGGNSHLVKWFQQQCQRHRSQPCLFQQPQPWSEPLYRHGKEEVEDLEDAMNCSNFSICLNCMDTFEHFFTAVTMHGKWYRHYFKSPQNSQLYFLFSSPFTKSFMQALYCLPSTVNLSRIVFKIIFVKPFVIDKQTLVLFVWEHWLHILSVRFLLASFSSSHLFSCLGRSFPRKCLNIIEIYSRHLSESKSILISIPIFNFNLTYNYAEMASVSSDSRSFKSSFLRDLAQFIHLICVHCGGFKVDYEGVSSGYDIVVSFNKNIVAVFINMRFILLQCGDIESNPGPYSINLPNGHKEQCDKAKIELQLMTQNCRGLQDRNKLRLLLKNKSKELQNCKSILALQETYLLNDTFIKWSGNYVISPSVSPHSAGCVTYLNEYVNIIEIKHIDDQGHGHVIAVEGFDAQLTIIANIYAPVRGLPREQEEFFDTLLSIIDEMERKYILKDPSLIILGDFNLPLELDIGSHNNNMAEVMRTRKLVEEMSARGLSDCWRAEDERYTYKTGRTRLDRILYRLSKDHKETLETVWTFTSSDHCLLKLSLSNEAERVRTARVTSLPTYILKNKEAISLINERMIDFNGNCMEHWDSKMKLEYLKMSLRTAVGEVVKIYNRKQKDELEKIQSDIIRRMNCIKFLPLCAHDENNAKLDLLFAKRNAILEERSEKLAEKAKTKWFYEGEKANKYFLNLLKKRRNNVEIDKLTTDRGEITEEGEINEEIENFYKELYENGGPSTNEIDETFFDNIVKVNEADVRKVTAPLAKEELYATLLTCEDSAPGPDGIPYSYYRHFWTFFGDLLARVFNDSIQEGGVLPDSHKISILRLLPKVDKDLTKLTNWRPITLSNCDHKLITKCLARRLTQAVTKCLHPSQTAYLPGKQIQDNLRIINIVNKSAPEALVVSLDAKKAFDSVSHLFIRKILTKFGLADFVSIFDVLYGKQKVKIAVNGNLLPGYEIKNGVKQGDSLSCILFIMCMDPLIRNIESNDLIDRIEIDGIPITKVVAYADDVTCIVNNERNSVQLIFKEYERLSKVSGLILNANKTEILNVTEQTFKVKYRGEEHSLHSRRNVKINGIIFDKDAGKMRDDNFNNLYNRIQMMLGGWSARGLSLLGKVLIYKTYGLSQVIYALSVICLNDRQYKMIDRAFNNFLWGRDLVSESNKSRISRERIYTPLEYGGFGMIQYEQVINGIACRQLAKLFDPEVIHPLKTMIIKNDVHFSTGVSLTNIADEIAVKAHNKITIKLLQNVKTMSNYQITQDVILINQLGALDIAKMIKPRWLNAIETLELIHTHRCENIRNIMEGGRITVQLSKKILRAPYVRIVKAFWSAGIQCHEIIEEKIRLSNGRYKQIHLIKSREFRELLQGEHRLLRPKLNLNFDMNDANDCYVLKSYFGMIKRLINTRHKNTLLRIWNGDCLSNTRLIHMNLSETNQCPDCAMLDTPLHMLIECNKAQQVWQRLMRGIFKNPTTDLLDYALGIADGKLELSIKAEVLKMLMHMRNLTADLIIRRAKNYFLTVQGSNLRVKQIFELIT